MQDFRMCMVICVDNATCRYAQKSDLSNTQPLTSFPSQKESDDPIKECLVLRDDYLECLHHRKEVSPSPHYPLLCGEWVE